MAWLPWAAGYLAAAIVLFLCYLRISETVTVTSDGAGIALQAWDMLHGNVLLHGWGLADVTFYTTEIPEYALVEIFRGLGPADVHICAAITYTLLVVLAGLLAKGNKTGKEGLVRVLIASGVMIAPQIGPGAFVLLLSPDHTGTSVPLLLIFLLLDRAPRRWWVPAAVGLMLAWTQIGDSLVAAIGAAPIVVVCGVRAYRGIVQGGEPVSVHWFDLALAVSAVVSVAVADAAVKIIGSLGGYTMATLDTVVARSASWAAHVSLTVDGLLHLYGAGLISGSLRFATGIAAVHLVGVALAAWATGRVIRRFFACDDMIAQILAVAIAVNVTAYAFSRLPTVLYASHEIAPVLPFGAVLAGRMLAERLARAKLLPALTAAACVYLAALAYGASLTPTPLRDQALINWLGAHHLTTGLGSYAEGDNIGLASHGTILIAVPEFHPASVDHRRLFLEKTSDFDPRQHNANFVVSTTEDGPSFHVPPAFAIRAFGRPARTYHYGPWTIMTWNKNLLYEIR
ncbi:MAG: hypothetical protein JOY82_03610 [Streptosporangiaceae bacterium]|nr:hypothetical protein [Streptosporangiaceae bacterium]MBV9853600.1 hypothetical protein [Streptosporangiaceae bacterium]